MNDVPLSADESPVYEFLVEHELSGVRIDSFLAKHLRNYTTWKLARMIGAGAGAINDVPASPADRVFTGQCVRVRLFEPPDKLLDALQTPLEILYEDHWMAVVNKPAGMVVHPTGELQGTSLANALQSHLDERCAPRGILRPGIVHRLDRQTSGAIVVAFTHNAHAALSSAFEQSRVAKQYMALVHGRVRQDQGTIDWPIGRTNTGRHVLMSCRADALDRKPAKTYYEVIERYADHTLVLAKPRTGRNHQIRVHFAHLGHPLLGDEFYEAHGRLRPFDGGFSGDGVDGIETGFPIRRHALHAVKLELSHPISGLWMTFEAPLAADFAATAKALGAIRFETSEAGKSAE